MRYINQSKPIKFSLLVGDRECHSVEEVKQNFDFNSLWDNLCNGSLEKWLGQIGETAMLKNSQIIDAADNLTKKVRLYNLFSPTPLSSDEVSEDDVMRLMSKGYVKFDDLKGTPFAANKKNFDDILERFGKLTVMVDSVAIEMIFVKGYSGGDFYIGKYPVTQLQWQAVMGGNPSNFKGDSNPMENVLWNDCQDFIKELNSKTGRKFRLPKEEEWEYAARGGNKTHNYAYSGSKNLAEVGWYQSNSGGRTHPVGKKKPNELGIYDMSGNVWEWCVDLFSSSASDRVIRGGSCLYTSSRCAVSSRHKQDPASRSRNIGFRLAMDA